MNKFEQDIARRIKEVKKREDAIALRERNSDKNERFHRQQAGFLKARKENMLARRDTILGSARLEATAFERFKKDKSFYKRLITTYNKAQGSIDNLRKDLFEKNKLLKEIKKQVDLKTKELDSRIVGIKKKEAFVSSKIATIKARERNLSKDLRRQVAGLSKRSALLKEEISSTKKRNDRYKEALANLKRKIDDAEIAVDKRSKDLDKKAAYLDKELSLLSNSGALIEKKNKEIKAQHTRIKNSHKAIRVLYSDIDKIKDGLKDKRIEIDARSLETEDLYKIAKKDYQIASDLEKTIKKKLTIIKQRLKSVLTREKSLGEWSDKNKNDAIVNERTRQKLARQRRDVNRKLKAIREWKKKNKKRRS